MIILGWWFVEDKAPVITSVPTNTATQSGISLSSLGTQAVVTETVSFNADLYFALLGWILLIGALVFNNKNITTKNERYGETIKKIRV
jgi:hypothetical protein